MKEDKLEKRDRMEVKRVDKIDKKNKLRVNKNFKVNEAMSVC